VLAWLRVAIQGNSALTGGRDIGEDFPVHVRSFVSSNLTPAGPLKRWSDGEIFRAIRDGIDADGHWLTLMSDTGAGKLSDDDIRAVIAYIRSVPTAGEETPNPPDRLNLLGVAMLGAGILPSGKPVFADRVAAPPKGPTFQFGEYLDEIEVGAERPHLPGHAPPVRFLPWHSRQSWYDRMWLDTCGIHHHDAHRHRSEPP
jgi:hypothetical protein